MRRRLLPVGTILALTLGLLTATPARAAYDINITFPGGNNDFYSPFDGPATIQFEFAGNEDDTLFRARLRPVGGNTIAIKYFSVDPDTQASGLTRSFTWDPLSVQTETQYEVLVNPDGGSVISTAVFTLKPPLVRITSIQPSTFLPWIEDGYKDTTDINYRLAATSQPTIIRVFKAKSDGKCCASEVFEHNDETQVVGNRSYEWDGRDSDGDLLPKGVYYAKVTATDPADLTRTSKPFKVTIARTYRDTATLEKNGIASHHTGPVTVYRRGGNCFVTKDETDKDLWITCLSASFKVYWRWSLPDGGRIENVSFVLIKVSGDICGAKKGHTTTDSFLQVGGVGQFRCRVDKAKITYSYLVSS